MGVLKWVKWNLHLNAFPIDDKFYARKLENIAVSGSSLRFDINSFSINFNKMF